MLEAVPWSCVLAARLVRSCLGAVYSLMEGFNLVLQVRIDFFFLGQEMATMRL